MNVWAKVALAGVAVLVLAPISLVTGWLTGTDSLLFVSMGASIAAPLLWVAALVGYLVTRSMEKAPTQ